MVNVIWSEFAIEDLQLIHEYISNDSKVYADRFVGKIINRVDQLQHFSKSVQKSAEKKNAGMHTNAYQR